LITYLDSSAVVKLFLDDEGGGESLRLAIGGSGVFVTSRLTLVETAAALAAARRSGRLSATEHASALASFRHVWAAMEVVELTAELADDAAEAADSFSLRAGDAVQFASVRHIGAVGTVLVAWDARLRAAALANGIACYPLEV
jgi:predicted nucleic acid-binding protein